MSQNSARVVMAELARLDPGLKGIDTLYLCTPSVSHRIEIGSLNQYRPNSRIISTSLATGLTSSLTMSLVPNNASRELIVDEACTKRTCSVIVISEQDSSPDVRACRKRNNFTPYLHFLRCWWAAASIAADYY